MRTVRDVAHSTPPRCQDPGARDLHPRARGALQYQRASPTESLVLAGVVARANGYITPRSASVLERLPAQAPPAQPTRRRGRPSRGVKLASRALEQSDSASTA